MSHSLEQKNSLGQTHRLGRFESFNWLIIASRGRLLLGNAVEKVGFESATKFA
jgi:hypothetical protein